MDENFPTKKYSDRLKI